MVDRQRKYRCKMITWNNQDEKRPCFPQYNKLGYFIERSRVDGIHNQYNEATNEICEIYNKMNERIFTLESINRGLTNALELAKVKNREARPPEEVHHSLPMQGRKPKSLDEMQVRAVEKMRKNGISYENIAKLMKVSSRTVRRAVKRENSYTQTN
jgi:hypothetical protein